MIIGRVGSGKTEILRSIHLDSRYKIIVELSSHKVFRQIIIAIENLSKDLTEDILLTDEVADIWKIIFWHIIFSKIAKFRRRNPDVEIIKKYLFSIGLSTRLSAHTIMTRTVKIIQEQYRSNCFDTVNEFEDVSHNSISFNNAYRASLNFLINQDIRAIILIDSLENFRLEDSKMSHAIAGLLRCQRSFRSPGGQNEVRICLPSEIYDAFIELSERPTADFSNKLMLNWHAEEGSFRWFLRL